MEIFQYSYMIKALIVGAFLSIIIPCMGIVVVHKKISVIGDALSHVSLAGVMLGLITSISPVGILVFLLSLSDIIPSTSITYSLRSDCATS